MTITDNIQSIFLDQIKRKLKSNESLADELAEILNISRDSAYRRIRGETVLSLDEAKLLCIRFGISLDNLVTGTGEMVSFHYRAVDAPNFTFDKWLKSLLANLESLMPFPDREIIYLANNVPPAYYFNFPLLATFKVFFWMNSLWHVEHLKGIKFSPKLVPNELIEVGKRFWKRYTDMPRIEIWSVETANTTLSQIEFYYEAGFFADAGYAPQLCDEYMSMIREVREWATVGYKDKPEQKFSLFKNDLLLPDTTILFKMGNKRFTMLPCNTMDLLTTSDEMFCKKAEEHLINLLSKSNLISTSGEKARNKFFNEIEEKTLQLKSRLK